MKTEIITGNFKLAIEGEFDRNGTIEVGKEKKPTPVGDLVDESAIAYIGQRDVLSAVYGELLEDGAKRNSLDYSDDAAKKIETKAEKELEPYGTFTVSVSEHVPGESAAPRAMATELWGKIKDNAAFRAQVGVAEGATDAQGIEAAHAFLSGLRKTPVRKPKAA